MPDLTICSVYHKKETSDLLSLNAALTRRLNTHANIRWVVSDNSPRDAHVRPPEGDFEIFPGYELKELERVYAPSIAVPFHGASALNNLLPQCRTEFALFLDADFFVVRPNWIADVIAHMREQKITAFGAPWHPQYYKKVRYYPMSACLFLSAYHIHPTELNFHPAYPMDKTHLATNPQEEFPKREKRSTTPFGRLWWSLKERYEVGGSRDVSYRVAALLKESGMRVESAVPVWRPEDQVRGINRVIDRVMPDRFSFMPRQGYYSPTGFKEKGVHDFYSEHMEEYLWHDEPFAIHVRNRSKRLDIPAEFTALHDSLFSFARS